MITVKKTPFEQAVGYLCGLKPLFGGLPRHVTETVCEIRLRVGRAIMLECNNGMRVRVKGVVTAEQMKECLREFCGYSVHSFEKQFREGWLTLAGGHRVGFTGTAVLKDGVVENVRDVCSVNIRVAREYIGCANRLYERIVESGESIAGFNGLLIIGQPMSAKTTFLRDLCRQVAANYKVALIDERSEIAAVHNGIPSLDVGENTDVLNNFPKAQGIMMSLRSLSPEYVFCDEIGWEAKELTALANSGIRMVLTAHSGSLREAYSSTRIRTLLCSGGISHIALLGNGKKLGEVISYERNKCNTGDCGDNAGDGCGALSLSAS